MSVWATAAVAANKAVRAPTQAIRLRLQGSAWARIGFNRVSRNTPEVTMVAAWMRAETGVGPAIASGNHTYNGSWADLPAAASISSTTITVATPVLISSDRVNTSA